MRHFIAVLGLACLALLITGCRHSASHGPVSAGTMRKLQAETISKDEFLQRLSGMDHSIRSALPASSVTVPFVLHSGTPVIEVTGPGNQPLSMLLDSGAARLVLGAQSAVKAAVHAGLTDLAWLERCPLLSELREDEGFIRARLEVGLVAGPVREAILKS